MKKLLVSIVILASLFLTSNTSAATDTCVKTIPDGSITFTHTRVRETYPSPLACTNLPAGAVITDVYQSYIFKNILSLGDIEVRLVSGNQQFELSVAITGTAPSTPETRGASTHSSAFNGMSAEAAFTLSAIFVDPSTNPNGYGLDATPISSYQLIVTYEYDDSPPPVADFSFSTTELIATFANLSTGGQGTLSYDWNFGDGGSSTVASPSHTYANAGTYSVSLTTTDELGRQSSPITKLVTVTAETISLDIGIVFYEYANCTFYSRNGTIYWDSLGSGISYQVEENVNNVYYNIYSGTSLGLSYSKTAYVTKTYQLRVRASLDGSVGDWKNFSVSVPHCSSGAPNPF